jgi:hypothetical protein
MTMALLLIGCAVFALAAAAVLLLDIFDPPND